MAETRIQRRTRERNERIEARECIADIEAMLNDIALTSDEALYKIQRRVKRFNQGA